MRADGSSTARMAWVGVGAILVITLVSGGQPGVASASSASPSQWAVLIEGDSYGGRYPSLPVGYVNSTRMLRVLLRHGWAADHILLIRDSLDPALLKRSVGWLAAHVQPGDTALFYIAGEFNYLTDHLRWTETFPALWRTVPTSERVLIMETCYAQRLADSVIGIPGMALPAVGSGELDVWSVRQTDRLIQGGAFTYFLTQALEREPEDVPLDFASAFRSAVEASQEYFRTVMRMTPAVLAVFHNGGAYPETLPIFPNPHLLETGPAPTLAQGASASP